MNHTRILLRAAAVVSSFGLIGSYVACQQNGGRLPGTGGPEAAAPATAPAAQAAGTTAPAVTPANFGTKSAMIFKPDATGQPALMPGSKSSTVANPALLSGSKSLVLVQPSHAPQLLVGSKSAAVFVPSGPPVVSGTVPPDALISTVTPPATAPATRPATAPATQPAARATN